jgi:hypothetical protein
MEIRKWARETTHDGGQQLKVESSKVKAPEGPRQEKQQHRAEIEIRK